MNLVADLALVLAGVVALLAGVGVLRLRTPYARFHAAGKASPVALIFVMVAALASADADVAALVVLATGSLVLTLPAGVHLLYRAVHRGTSQRRPAIDELAPAEASARAASTADPDA